VIKHRGKRLNISGLYCLKRTSFLAVLDTPQLNAGPIMKNRPAKMLRGGVNVGLRIICDRG